MNVCSKSEKVRKVKFPSKISLVRTSTATIAKVKTSPSLLAGPPPKISGAAHVVTFVLEGS